MRWRCRLCRRVVARQDVGGGLGAEHPDFWLSQATPSTPQHLAFRAKSRADVDAMHALLQRIGAVILDAPAVYPRYGAGYYALFFADPDGLKLEFVHWP